MARKRKYLVGKTPVDLDKIESAKPSVVRRIRCKHCNSRMKIQGPAENLYYLTCPDCGHSGGYIVPEADAL